MVQRTGGVLPDIEARDPRFQAAGDNGQIEPHAVDPVAGDVIGPGPAEAAYIDPAINDSDGNRLAGYVKK
jgi:hypothetical protein